MPVIRNSSLFKKFTDFFQLKSNDFLDSEAGRMLVPVITHPIPPLIVSFTPTEAQWASGIPVPAGKKWKILLANVGWISDVNAGNREIMIQIFDAGNMLVEHASRNFQAASLQVNYCFFVGAPSVGSSSGLFQSIAIPDLFLTEGQLITIVDFSGIAAGDTVDNSLLIVEEEDILENEIETRAV